MWNGKIAPTVREAVIRGTGKETSSDGQQKVANTALYVLMQKAVVPGCPLSGQGQSMRARSCRYGQGLSMWPRSSHCNVGQI